MKLVGGIAAAGCALALLASPAAAESDTELWSEVGFRHKLNSHWRLSLDQGLRMSDAASRFSSSVSDVGLSLRAKKWLRFAFVYRLSYKQKRGGDTEVRQRLQADVRVRLRWGKLTGSYRLRIQEQYRMDANRSALRNQVALGYRASRRVRPFLSAELFHTLGAGMDPNELAKLRLTLGTSYSWRTRSLDMFYRFEQPIADDSEPMVHILGLGYKFSL